MTRQRWWVGGAAVVLAVAGFALAQPGGQQRDKRGGDEKAVDRPGGFTGKAAFVTMKGPPQSLTPIENPQFRTIGQHTFLVGKIVNGEQLVWLPASEIARIEEFADLEALGKFWHIGPRAKKGP